MTPLRQRESLEAELASLEQLLRTTQDDPLATPLLRSRVEELQGKLKALSEHPPLKPETELFFADGPAMGSEGLEVTFTSEVLNSYQNMVTNHYAAKHYGSLRRTGRRRGEDETRLFLTALPRGSFGLQLCQPHVTDFIAANDVSSAMQDISRLIEATATSDEAFEAALADFDARVLKPLKRFITTVHSGGGTCRVITGQRETILTRVQITDAYARITAAVADDEPVTMSGVFGGAQLFSGSFEFQPDTGDLIRGSLDPELSEEVAAAMNRDFTKKRAIAKMNMTTVSTRAGKKKPTYELRALLPTEAPHRRGVEATLLGTEAAGDGPASSSTQVKSPGEQPPAYGVQ